MDVALAAASKSFAAAFREELAAALAVVRAEPDARGFAVFPPVDFGDPDIMAFVGKKPAEPEEAGTLASSMRLYSPGEDGWDPRPDLDFTRSFEAIERACEAHHDRLVWDEDGDPPEGEAFREVLYGSILDAMADAVTAGEFGGVEYRLIAFNDDDFPIQAESIRQLNAPATATAALRVI